MDINIKIVASEAFCSAIDNLANTLVAAACVATPKHETPAAVTPATVTPAAVTPAAVTPASAPVPTSPVTYTQDQLALAASGLIDAGRLVELQQLLATFKVASLIELTPDRYGAFATKLREMGAKI